MIPVSCPINSLLDPPVDFRAGQGAPTRHNGDYGEEAQRRPARKDAAQRARNLWDRTLAIAALMDPMGAVLDGGGRTGQPDRRPSHPKPPIVGNPVRYLRGRHHHAGNLDEGAPRREMADSGTGPRLRGLPTTSPDALTLRTEAAYTLRQSSAITSSLSEMTRAAS